MFSHSTSCRIVQALSIAKKAREDRGKIAAGPSFAQDTQTKPCRRLPLQFMAKDLWSIEPATAWEQYTGESP